MVKLSEIERIEILMMVGYGDRQRSHQDVCDSFSNVHSNRNPTVQFIMSKLLEKFKQNWRCEGYPWTSKIGQKSCSSCLQSVYTFD